MGNSPSSTGQEQDVQPVDPKALAQQWLQTGVKPEELGGETTPPITEENNDGGDTGNNQHSSDDNSSDSSSGQRPLGGHPAWQEILTAVPEEYHQALAPKLKEWDAGVTKRFQEIHSQYDPLKDFAPIAEQGVDADTVSSALGLFQAINQDPRSVWQALGETYGYVGEQGSTDDYYSSEDDDTEYRLPPEIIEQLQRQEAAIEQMSQFIAQTQETQTVEQQQQELDAYLGQLERQYGKFDEDYVLTKIAAGVDPELAVRQYLDIVGVQTVNGNGQQPPPQVQPPQAPSILGSSGSGAGGIPTQRPDITKLDRKATRNVVAEILAAQHSANGQP